MVLREGQRAPQGISVFVYSLRSVRTCSGDLARRPVSRHLFSRTNSDDDAASRKPLDQLCGRQLWQQEPARGHRGPTHDVR